MNDDDDFEVQELDMPPGALDDPRSFEILRAWITAKGLEVALTKPWNEPDNWGIFLVDIARHAARVYEMEHDCSYDDAMAKIKEMFELEWKRPTDEGSTTPDETKH